MMKETVKGLEIHKLLNSKDDIEIRRTKFEKMQEAEKLGNKIWKLGLEKKKLLSEVTKLQARERQLLGIPEIKEEE